MKAKLITEEESYNYEGLIVELESIKSRLEELIEEAEYLVNNVLPGSVGARADAYWLAQLKIALGGEHGYIGSAGVSMQDTIEELREEAKFPSEDDLLQKKLAGRKRRIG